MIADTVVVFTKKLTTPTECLLDNQKEVIVSELEVRIFSFAAITFFLDFCIFMQLMEPSTLRQTIDISEAAILTNLSHEISNHRIKLSDIFY